MPCRFNLIMLPYENCYTTLQNEGIGPKVLPLVIGRRSLGKKRPLRG